jgi:hypothetical protein
MADENQTAGVGANGLPLVENVQSYSPQSTTTRVVPTQQWRDSEKAVSQAAGDEITGVQNETAAKVQAASDEAAVMQPGVDADFRQQTDRITQQEESRQRIEEARQKVTQTIADASKEPTKFWDDRTADQRTYARIGVALGGLAQGLSGSKSNQVLDYLEREVDRDTKAKQARAEHLYKLAEQSRGMLSDAYRERAEDLSNADLNRAANWSIIQKQAETIAKSGMAGQLTAQGQQLIAQIQGKTAGNIQAFENNLNTKTESQSARSVTTQKLGGSSGSTARVADADKAAMAQEMAEKAQDFAALSAKGAAPSAEQQADYYDRENKMVARQKSESESTVQSALGSVGRKAGVLPSGTFPEDWTEDNRRYMQLKTDMMHAYKVAQLGGSSGLNTPEGYQHFVSTGMTGRGVTPEQAAAEDKDLIRWAQTQNQYVKDASRTGNITEAKGSDAKVAQRMGNPSTAKAQDPMASMDLATAKAKAQAILKADPNNARMAKFLRDHP